MGDKRTVEVELDTHGYAMLQLESERLGLGMHEVLHRALAAWITDMGNDYQVVQGTDPTAG
jgi:hypothetical protein